MGFEVNSFQSSTELAQAVAARWLEELAGRSEGDDPYCVALSGGRITRGFFAETVRQAKARRVSFAGVHFFWADERCVPPTDPESNFGIADHDLFQPLGISGNQIHRLKGEEPEALALRDAVKNICSAARVNAEGQPVLDLVFLGMGEDGHVASLFPGEPEEMVNDDAVYRVVIAVKPPPKRITLGYKPIIAAREVWVLASGPGKEKALSESLSPSGKTPLARVLRSRVQTSIFTDIKATK